MMSALYRLLGHIGILVAAGFTLLFSGALSAQDSGVKSANIMLVFDASGSMWGRINEVPKIDIARQVMRDVLGEMDRNMHVGVIAYGHRRKGDCNDIETVMPLGPVTPAEYQAAIDALQPKGKTPITAAVRKGAQELTFREEKATVILISDGLETCNADPCAMAGELEKQGIDFTIHVVGFDLKDTDTSSLQCLADKTGGKFISAENAKELGEALDTVVAEVEPQPAPAEPEPAAKTELKVNVRLATGTKPLEDAVVEIYHDTGSEEKGKRVTYGRASKKFALEPGRYYIETNYGASSAGIVADVVKATENQAEIVLDSGLLKVTTFASEGGEVLKKAYTRVFSGDDDLQGNRKQIAAGGPSKQFILKAGRYFLTIADGQAKVSREIEIAAGERHDLDVVIGLGLLKVTAYASEGGQALARAYIQVLSAKADINGDHKRVAGGGVNSEFRLPAGKYLIHVKDGAAAVHQDVEIKAGERHDIDVIIGLGILKVTALPIAGAKPVKGAYIRIYEAEKGLDGSRKSITGGNQNQQFKLPPGSYHITAKINAHLIVARDIEVTAGERSDETVILNAGALRVTSTGNPYVRIFAAEKNLDGTREQITAYRPGGGKPIMLKQGSYVATAKGASETTEAAFDITAGKLTELDLNPQ